MPKTTSKGRAKQSELPDTLRKSSDKAQRTFAKAHDSAVKTYGEGQHAHRVAYAALKHSFEKVGDHWEEKETRGPSDERARSGGPNARGKTAEGVDTSATKDHLLSIARRLEIRGRSSMNSLPRSKKPIGARAERTEQAISRKWGRLTRERPVGPTALSAGYFK